MNVKHLLNEESQEKLIDELEDFFNENSDCFGIEQFCHRTGCGEVDSVEITNFERDDGQITFKASVEFTEVQSTTCAKVELNYNKSCSFDITILDDGEVEIGEGYEGWDGEEYGEQNFDDFDDEPVDL